MQTWLEAIKTDKQTSHDSSSEHFFSLPPFLLSPFSPSLFFLTRSGTFVTNDHRIAVRCINVVCQQKPHYLTLFFACSLFLSWNYKQMKHRNTENTSKSFKSTFFFTRVRLDKQHFNITTTLQHWFPFWIFPFYFTGLYADLLPTYFHSYKNIFHHIFHTNIFPQHIKTLSVIFLITVNHNIIQ